MHFSVLFLQKCRFCYSIWVVQIPCKAYCVIVRPTPKHITGVLVSAEVIPTDKEEVAFKDLDVAILVGSMPRRDGMERKDLLKANVAIFKAQGTALDKYAKKTVKVVWRPVFYF